MHDPAIHALEAAREQAISALREADLAAKALRAEVRSYEEALNLLRGAPSELRAPVSSLGGSLKDAVIQAVESADHPLKAGEILSAIAASGRPTSMNSLLSTLSRITRDQLIHSPSRGLWCKLMDDAGLPTKSAGDSQAVMEELPGDTDPAS